MEGGGEVSDDLIKLTVTPVFSRDSNAFGCLTTNAAGEISRRVAYAEEAAIKMALKALGWMPPEDAAAMREAIRDAHDAGRACEDTLEKTGWPDCAQRLSESLSKLQPFLKP
jgi:hypothetical protein